MNVTVLSSARWSSFWVSKQLVSRALAALNHSVLYVDPPVSPLSIVRQPGRFADLRGIRDETIDGVRVWRPVVMPGQNSGAGQHINAELLARGARHRMADPDVTVAFSLESRTVFKKLGGRRVYYCTDSLEDLPGADASAYRRWELELATTADITVACSLPLVHQLRARGVDAHYLPHAGDAAPEVAAEPGPPPAMLRDVPRPLLGYVGSLNFRVDPELLLRATRHGTLVVIGGDFGPAPAGALRDLLADRRVIATGHQPPQDIARWMAHLDVGLIPYTNVPFNRKSFPIKLLQYLAAGLPVVSTPNGATDEHPDLVEVADGADAFDAAISRALADTTLAARQERQRRAASRTWRDVASTLLDLAGPVSP